MQTNFIKAARVFANMAERCYNENNKGFKNYGGRGIYIDDQWLNNPTNFFQWYEKNYFEKGQVDRIDNDGPYSPNNCRMVSRTENVRNRRNTVSLDAFGQAKPLIEWVEDERCFISYSTLNSRINHGWNVEKAISLPLGEVESKKYVIKNNDIKRRGAHPNDPQYIAFGETKTLIEWFEDSRCSLSDKRVLWSRINLGWPIEDAISKKPGRNAGIEVQGKSILQWSKDPQCQVSYKVLKSRLEKGIELELALQE